MKQYSYQQGWSPAYFMLDQKLFSNIFFFIIITYSILPFVTQMTLSIQVNSIQFITKIMSKKRDNRFSGCIIP